jgi:hypothetical protein
MPRASVLLEKPLYDRVRRLAAKEQICLSLKIRDLIKDAVEAQEDIVLAKPSKSGRRFFTGLGSSAISRSGVHRRTRPVLSHGAP